MAEEKQRTVKVMKEKRTVSEEVKANIKHYNKMKKLIKEVLKEGPKTIPEIAKATQLPAHEATYFLMSMRKYGDVVTGEIDDMDEYFYYHLNQKN